MYTRESHRAKLNHHAKKQQEQKVSLFPRPTILVPPSEIKTIEETASEYGEEHTLEITIEEAWFQAFANKSPTQFQHQLTDLVKNTIHTQESFFNKISYFMSSLIQFSNEKRFLVNWDISRILSAGKLRPTGVNYLFRQDYLTKLNCNRRYYQTIKKGSLSSIKNVLNTYQRLFKAKSAQHILKRYSQQQDIYLEQLKKSFLKLTLIIEEQSFRKEKSKINKVLQDFMMTAFCNQFILIVTNILEILSNLYPDNKYFIYFLILLLSKAINISDIKSIGKQLILIHGKCIKLASQFDSDQKMSKNPYGKSKKQKQEKTDTKTISSKDTNFKQSKQQSKTQPVSKSKSEQSPTIFVKVYLEKPDIQKIYWVHKKYIKYMKIDRNNTNIIQFYRIQAKVKENQMKVLRYLCSIKKNFVFKYKISIDKHPENEQNQKENPSLQPSLCFEFQSIKADKDYATRFNQQTRQSTTREDLWAFRDKDLIYHFIICFAASIAQLEASSIHYLDFRYENFVKFHKIFELIDMEHAYVVDLNNQSFQKTNRELFQLWLQSSLNDTSLTCLINSSQTNYQHIKKDYMENKENKLTKQQAVDRCILLMHENMKKHHYSRFYQLCHDLLSDKFSKIQGFPLSKIELDIIRSKIPQQPINLKGFYNNFIKNIQAIYSRYNQNTNLINGYQHSIRKYLQTITDPVIVNEMIRKRIFFTRKFQQLPLQFCYSQDQIIVKRQEVMIRSRKDHTLVSIDRIYQKQRYIVQFLLCCVLLLQELDKNGLILLNLEIQSFVRSGEAFFLKSFIHLFKVGPKFNEKTIRIQSDVLLHKMSLQLLAKLSTKRQDLRQNDFDKGTLYNIYKIVVLDYKDEGCQKMSTIQRINIFFQGNIKKIHFYQFKRLALSLLNDAPKHFKNTEDLKGYVNAKNLANFYTLIEDLRDFDIVSSF